MMIRSMSPEVIVVDEIGRAEDAEAIEEAMHAGIRVIATAHGNGLSDIVKRPVLRSLIHGKRFERLVVLDSLADPGTISGVYDADGHPVRPALLTKV